MQPFPPARRHDRPGVGDEIVFVPAAVREASQPKIHLPASPVFQGPQTGVGWEGAAIWPDRPVGCGLRGPVGHVRREGDYQVGALFVFF